MKKLVLIVIDGLDMIDDGGLIEVQRAGCLVTQAIERKLHVFGGDATVSLVPLDALMQPECVDEPIRGHLVPLRKIRLNSTGLRRIVPDQAAVDLPGDRVVLGIPDPRGIDVVDVVHEADPEFLPIWSSGGGSDPAERSEPEHEDCGEPPKHCGFPGRRKHTNSPPPIVKHGSRLRPKQAPLNPFPAMCCQNSIN